MKKDKTLDALMGLKTAIDSAVSIMDTAKDQEANAKQLDKEVKSLESLKVSLTASIGKLKENHSATELELALDIEQKKEKAEKVIAQMVAEAELLVAKSKSKYKKASDKHVALCEQLKSVQRDIDDARVELRTVTETKIGLLTALGA